MSFWNKLFGKEKTLGDHLATIGKYYIQEANDEEFSEALESTVPCPSCSKPFKIVDAVTMDGGNMSIVCPSCGSLEAQIKRQ
jgi:hypothetical protein